MFDCVIRHLKDAGVPLALVDDEVRPNPRGEDCEKASQLGREQHCDVLAALERYSFISAKVVGVRMTLLGNGVKRT
jgi:alcohol dehydrogenase class IV